MEKYLQYIKEFQENNKAGLFFVENQLKKHLENNPENQTEIEHILDFLYSTKKVYKNIGYSTIKEKADKWSVELQKVSVKDNEKEGVDYEVIKEWSDFKMVKLLSKDAYQREGKIMCHCVGSYYGKDDKIYSLRDKLNMPHATLSKSSQQIKGKGNGLIHPKYIKYVVEFLEYLKIEVRYNEMKNLGYIDVEKWLEYIDDESKKLLFKGKYWYWKDTKLKTKTGDEFATMELWDNIPLLEEKNNKIECNFDLKTFIPLSFKFLWEQCKKKVSGDYGKSSVSGNSGMSSAFGKESIACVLGSKGKAQGSIGAWLVLCEYNGTKILNIKSVKVDGKKIKEKTWYELKKGKFVEVK